MSSCSRCEVVRSVNDEHVNLDDCYNLLMSLIKLAGNLAMEGFNKTDKQTEAKRGDFDLVTIYDKSIENLFIESIRKIYPNHLFLGEETTKERVLTDKPTWIIDPIDGTSNYVHDIPIFGIAVAFSVHKDLKFGVTYSPVYDELYTARKGQGAFLNGKPISCTDTKTLNTAMCLAEPLFQVEGPIRDKCIKRMHKIGCISRGVRSLGCASMALAYVASGRFDAYHVEDLAPWDLAAGAILIREAGGFVFNCDGSPYDFMLGSIATAGTMELCQSTIDAVKEADSTSLTVA